MNIYLATSWKNEYQPKLVKLLRELGHDVYDFRNPSPTDKGFSWSEIGLDVNICDNLEYIQALNHTRTIEGFLSDKTAIDKADICLMILPCGKSSHLELGYAAGKGKKTIILLDENDKPEPELMYKFADNICLNIFEVIAIINKPRTKSELW